MTRISKLLESYKQLVGEFGDPERSMRERRKMLKQLHEMEVEIDKYYNIGE